MIATGSAGGGCRSDTNILWQPQQHPTSEEPHLPHSHQTHSSAHRSNMQLMDPKRWSRTQIRSEWSTSIQSIFTKPFRFNKLWHCSEMHGLEHLNAPHLMGRSVGSNKARERPADKGVEYECIIAVFTLSLWIAQVWGNYVNSIKGSCPRLVTI